MTATLSQLPPQTLRHFACGYRDFRKFPDIECVRYNWVILVSFDGNLRPRLSSMEGENEEPEANFFIIPPQTRYVLIPEKPLCNRAVFQFASVGEILRNEVARRGGFKKRLEAEELREAKTIARLVKRPFEAPDLLSDLYFESALLRLTILALQGLNFDRITPLLNVPRERVSKAIAWYSDNLDKSPSLSQVADNIHISVTQLRRHFYEQLGRSPKAVLGKLRMQKATELLTGTSLALEQVGARCGFQNSSDFCRAFKRVFKATPTRWRDDFTVSGRNSRLAPED